MAEAYTDSQREAVDTSKPLYSAASLYTACKCVVSNLSVCIIIIYIDMYSNYPLWQQEDENSQ